MADEAAYGAGGESNKRKYDDSPPRVPRRASGFSSAPDFAAPPSSYNSAQPPLNEIELAKQKAQEVAARLLNNSDPSKRARVENGAGLGGGGYDAYDTGSGQKYSGSGFSGQPQSASYSASYGYPGSTKKIEIPNGKVGVIIGKGGETIKLLQRESGAKIQVTRDTDANPNSATRAVELTGAPEQIAKAEQMINDVLSEADTGGSGIGNRMFNGQGGGEQFSMKVPNNKVGLVIGKGGETIKSMQAQTGARIQVIPLHPPPGDMSKERTVQIDGTNEQIEAAKQLIEEVTSENRMRNQYTVGGGGYNSQQGYQSRPPTNWSQPGPPMQQPGYGYTQPGAYPGPPQYNVNQQQPNYSGYPPTSGWDQSQQTAQGGGSYDYYSQQQQQQPTQQQQTQGGSADYNYNQAQSYSQGQGYGQDGYGYNYGQPQTNPVPGYNQQQQGYNNPAYPAPDGQTTSYEKPPETNQAPPAQPSPNPNDPHQGSTQTGYGTQPPSGYGSNVTPQAQKPSGQPAAYSLPQQSPSSQGSGYAQYSQPPPAQLAGYGAPPYGGPMPAQPGYGAPPPPPPYGAPPAAQPRYAPYGQQPYGGGYGGGYSSTQQAPAYSSDAIAPQSAGGPPGAAKASSPS